MQIIHFAEVAMLEALLSESGTACSMMAASQGVNYIIPVAVQDSLDCFPLHPKGFNYTNSRQTAPRNPSFPPLSNCRGQLPRLLVFCSPFQHLQNASSPVRKY